MQLAYLFNKEEYYMLEIILIAVGIAIGIVGITLILSLIINKSKKLDSKESFIHDLLPELDCGKCGFPKAPRER